LESQKLTNEDAIVRRLTAGSEIVQLAGRFAAERLQRGSMQEAGLNGAQDWVTNVDKEAEALVRARLGDGFPEDGVLGEEGGGSMGGAAWIIDPIDGTANFARGSPLWCISLAFVIDGDAHLGFVFAPLLNQLFVARRDRGSTLNGSAIAVRHTAKPANAMVELGWVPSSGFDAYQGPLEAIAAKGYDFLRLGVGALSLSYIAAGMLDGYTERGMNAWDGMAGWLMAREAGAAVNAYDHGCLSNNKCDIFVGATEQIRLDLAEANAVQHD
jgi:myo-inositol-1(or 4)-monophosphatase